MTCIRRCSLLLLLTVIVVVTETSLAFTMQMAYKPPMQSSVDSLSSSRIPRSSRSNNSPSLSRSSTSTSSNNAVAMDAEDVSGSSSSSLRRVKDLVLGGLKNRIPQRPDDDVQPPPQAQVVVEVIEDMKDFEDIVLLRRHTNESQKNYLVAVMFHAPFCKACQAAAPHFYKLAKRYTGVKFVSVPLTDANSNMVKALGIQKFPFAHIYDPQKGLVDELPILRKLIPKFEERLRSYM